MISSTTTTDSRYAGPAYAEGAVTAVGGLNSRARSSRTVPGERVPGAALAASRLVPTALPVLSLGINFYLVNL
jgi:hypothetical protein